MTPYEYGGIGTVECYFKAQHPSPCAPCARLTEDKEMCSQRCEALRQWQEKTKALPRFAKTVDIKKMGSNGRRVCGECGIGELRYSDGVIYCKNCLAVHMKFEERDTLKEVEYLVGRGWTVEQMAEVLKVGAPHVAQLAKRCGVEFVHYYTEEEKRVIVGHSMTYGSKAAAERFGVNTDTVNRYARQLGVGKAGRYKRLKKLAKSMFRDGASNAQVIEALGVSYKTVRVWRKKCKT